MEEDSALGRFLKMSGMGAVQGIFDPPNHNAIKNRGKILGTKYYNKAAPMATTQKGNIARGVARGGGAQALGELFASDSDEITKSAIGGAMYGAGEGFGKAGKSPFMGGIRDLLVKKGMGKGPASALLLALGAGSQSAGSGIMRGLESSFLNT